MLDDERTSKNHGVLVESWPLSGLLPPPRAPHVRNAHGLRAGIHAAEKLVDDLRFVASRGDARRFGNELGHDGSSRGARVIKRVGLTGTPFLEFDGSKPSRGEFLYLVLSGIFIGSLVVTNVIAGKFFVLFGHPLSCGIIAYPITFLATDLICELFGKERATQLVRVGFIVSLFVTTVIMLAHAAPAADVTYVDQASFSRVFGLTPGIVFGSMCAYLIAQSIDVRVFHYWKDLTRGRHLWLRNNGSTLLSQLLDTVVVTTVTLGIWPLLDGDPSTASAEGHVLLDLIVGQYVFKAVVALLDTPIFYFGAATLGGWLRSEDAHAIPTSAE
jgi:uncharacterized integral membrane protein (TIGR00697 family)